MLLFPRSDGDRQALMTASGAILLILSSRLLNTHLGSVFDARAWTWGCLNGPCQKMSKWRWRWEDEGWWSWWGWSWRWRLMHLRNGGGTQQLGDVKTVFLILSWLNKRQRTGVEPVLRTTTTAMALDCYWRRAVVTITLWVFSFFCFRLIVAETAGSSLIRYFPFENRTVRGALRMERV